MNLLFVGRLHAIFVLLGYVLEEGMMSSKTLIFSLLLLVLLRSVEEEAKFSIFFGIAFCGVNFVGLKLRGVILISL